MKKTLSILISIMAMALIYTGCSQSQMADFQANDQQPAYNLLKLFDGFPALHSAIDSLDTQRLNDVLGDMITNGYETPDFLRTASDLVRAPFLVPMIGELRELVDILVDTSPKYRAGTPSDLGFYGNSDLDYNLEHYGYEALESVLDNTELSPEIFAIMEQVMNYLDAKYGLSTNTPDLTGLSSGIDDFVNDLFEDKLPLGAPDGVPDIKSTVGKLSKLLGKLLVAADYPMWLDGSGNLITNRTDCPGTTNTDLGNAAYGLNLVLRGLSSVTRNDVTARNYIYDILRQDVPQLIDPANNADDIMKQLIITMADLYSPGETGHAHTYDTSSNGYYQSGTHPYVNAALKQTIQDLLPSMTKLFIRDDETGSIPDYSIFENSNHYSPLEAFTVTLDRFRQIGIDYSDMTNNGLEDSLLKMVQKDAKGNDRSASSPMSYLDRLVNTIAGSYYFGYLTWPSGAGDADYDAEPESNFYRKHGTATNGIITVNDSMYGMKTKALLGMPGLDSYSLALDKRTTQAKHIARSSSSFVREYDGDHSIVNHKFYMGYDYPTMMLLPSNCAGDAGIPNGGETAVTVNENTTQSTTGGTNDYRTYFPRVPDGKGILNTAEFLMSWMARACWDGQGPYYYSDPSATQQTINGHTGYVYYKPNGEIYAVVTKPSSDPSTWTYYYPVSGNDVADEDGTGQRANRYRDTWKSDYYLIHFNDGLWGLGGKKFCPPPMNPYGISRNLVKGSTGEDKYNLVGADDDNHNASYFQFYEKIKETDGIRACASQEEAMFRNLQWFLLEKKMVFIIPMWISAIDTFFSTAYIIIEGNGALGLANARKGKANGQWASDHTESVQIGEGDVATANVPDYRDSSRPGDGRVIVFNKEIIKFDCSLIGLGEVGVSASILFNQVLGSGYVLPDIVGRNIDPVPRMGFLQPELVSSNTTGTAWSTAWANRSKVFPLLLALTATMYDGMKYTKSTSGYNYNYAGKHKYPLRDMLEGVFIPLSKPFFRHYNTSKGGRWVPRTKDETKGIYSCFTAKDSDSVSMDYFMPRDSLRSLVSVIGGKNADSATDGLVPLLAEKTQTVTRLMALLQRLGGTERAADREKIFKGLEQVMTAIKVDKSEIIQNSYYTTLNFSNYQWMFDKRTEDASLMDFLTYNGIHQSTDDWTDFTDMFNLLGHFVGGDRNIIPNLITVLDAVLNQNLTDDQIQGLLYMAGKIFAQYNGTDWQFHGDDHGTTDTYDPLYDLLFALKDLNAYMKLSSTGTGNAGKNYQLALRNMNLLLQDDQSILHYVVNTMHTPYSLEDVVMDLDRFLRWSIVSDPNSPLWDDLVLMLDAMADMNDPHIDIDAIIKNIGFQVNE